MTQAAAKLRRSVYRPPLPNYATKCVHLGCGEIDKPGFINVDGYPRKHVHFVQAIDRLPIFEDHSIDFIYVSHALEHFPYGETARVLREWHRVLRRNGRLCLSVPDFDVIVAMYEASNHEILSVLAPLMGGQDYRYNFHYTVFNRNSLMTLLFEVGFRSVASWEHGSDELHNFPDWSGRSLRIGGKDFVISLNLEATK